MPAAYQVRESRIRNSFAKAGLKTFGHMAESYSDLAPRLRLKPRRSELAIDASRVRYCVTGIFAEARVRRHLARLDRRSGTADGSCLMPGALGPGGTLLEGHGLSREPSASANGVFRRHLHIAARFRRESSSPAAAAVFSIVRTSLADGMSRLEGDRLRSLVPGYPGATGSKSAMLGVDQCLWTQVDGPRVVPTGWLRWPIRNCSNATSGRRHRIRDIWFGLRDHASRTHAGLASTRQALARHWQAPTRVWSGARPTPSEGTRRRGKDAM